MKPDYECLMRYVTFSGPVFTTVLRKAADYLDEHYPRYADFGDCGPLDVNWDDINEVHRISFYVEQVSADL